MRHSSAASDKSTRGGWGEARLALVTIVLAMLACGAPPERAEESMTRVGGDFIAAGPSLTFSDSALGDVILAGGDVTFNGNTLGDLLAAAGSISVTGQVGGSMRAVGGKVHIGERIARNATLIGGEVSLDKEGCVDGNVYFAGGRITIQGTVVGAIHAGGAEVLLDGPVGGDVRIEAERLTIGPAARIEGILSYRVPAANVRVDTAARIAGGTVVLPPRPESPSQFFLHALLLLAFLGAGSIAVASFPRTVSAATTQLRERTAASVGSGVLLMFCVPIALLLMLVTVIGIPIAIIVAALSGILLYLSGAVTAVWLGGQLMRRENDARRSAVVAQFLVGAIVVGMLGFVPLLGIMVKILAAVAGAGALLMTVRQHPVTTAAPVPT